MTAHGPALMSLLSAGKLIAIDDERAVIRYGAQHETFVKMLDRNGKKDLVRDGLSRLLNRSVGVKFEVEPAEFAPAQTEQPPPAPRAEAARPVREVAPVESASTPGRAPTAKIIAAIREQTPLVKALMDGLGATVIKVE